MIHHTMKHHFHHYLLSFMHHATIILLTVFFIKKINNDVPQPYLPTLQHSTLSILAPCVHFIMT